MKRPIIITLILILVANIAVRADSYDVIIKESITAINLKKYDQAENIVSDILENYPDRPEGYCVSAYLNIATGKYKAAFEQLKNAEKLSDNYAETYYLLGIVSEKLKKYDQAQRSYSKFLTLQPESKQKGKIQNKIKYLKNKKDADKDLKSNSDE